MKVIVRVQLTCGPSAQKNDRIGRCEALSKSAEDLGAEFQSVYRDPRDPVGFEPDFSRLYSIDRRDAPTFMRLLEASDSGVRCAYYNFNP